MNSSRIKLNNNISGKVLNRETFTFSRELEFFQERELTAQIGVKREYWPLVILKELIDNALDACETAGISPVIDINFAKRLLDEEWGNVIDSITVSDNGPGLPSKIVTKILDFKTRTSDKEAYRSPTRGQQGNALKTILAIPFIESGEEGHLVIESQGIHHDIRVSLDTIAQHPVISHTKERIVKKGGCSITVYTSICHEHYRVSFLQIVANYATFNPHLALGINGLIDERIFDRATDTTWRKWTPSDPTSPYWYNQEDLSRLINAYIAKARNDGRDYTLREFVSQFRGLSSTRKQKAITDQIPGVRRLSDMVNGKGLEIEKVALILQLMKQETKPVKPETLGIIGEAHFKRVQAADDMKYYCYRHKGEMPFVVEAAFAYDAELPESETVIGLNFAPVTGDPFGGGTQLEAHYRQEIKYGWGVNALAQAFKLNREDGARLIIHVTHPALIFQDRGKTHIAASGELKQAVGKAIGEVLKEHCATRRREDREQAAEIRAQEQWTKAAKSWIPSLREAVFTVMAEAVDKASGGGKLPYSVRQLYYQVRPLIQQYTRRELGYAYFTPPLVTEYEDEYGPLDGLIYDARGHLYEPHNGNQVALGTTDVASYEIPDWEYDKILYIEKEGFNAIFQAADLGRRYDMAIMTSKGFATRAAKLLLSRATGKQITILAAHDADISGYEITRTLAEETRTSKGLDIKVIDIGLNITDALAMNLEKERVTVKRELPSALSKNLTEEEYNFLKQYRIELNAMTTDQLINWIENALAENGLASKVVPPAEVLAEAINTQLELSISERADQAVNKAIETILGIDLISLGRELAEELEKPEAGGHLGDLIDYMADCPVTHWREWAEIRALKLAGESTKDLHIMAENVVKERLNR